MEPILTLFSEIEKVLSNQQINHELLTALELKIR